MFQRLSYKHKPFLGLFLMLVLLGQGLSSAYAVSYMGSSNLISGSDKAVSDNMNPMGSHCDNMSMSDSSRGSSSGSISSIDEHAQDMDCCPDQCSCPLGGCVSQFFLDSFISHSLTTNASVLFEEKHLDIVRISSTLYRPPILA